MGSESVGVVGGNTGGVNQGGVSLSLPLAIDSVGVAGVGVGVVGGVAGHEVGGGDGSDGGVGDHSNVVRSSILDCLGNMCSCRNLTNSPGLGLSLSLPLAIGSVVGIGVAIGVWHCSSNSGVGEASNLDSAMVSGGRDHSSVGLTSQNLADGVRIGLTSDSSHQGNNNEGFHIEAS